MAARPNIISRAQWGARTAVAGNRHVAPSQRRLFIVHWPVMSQRGDHQWARDIEAMHARSISSAAAPAYNFLVSNATGAIMEGCGRDVRGPASGTNEANVTGWACCVLQPSTAAGVPTAPISQAAKNSTRALYEWLCTVAGRRLTMRGHRQIVATACPGPDLFAWVQAGMPATGGAAPAPTPTPPPEEDEMIASAVVRGQTMVFVARPDAVYVTWQGPSGLNWAGGGSGWAAGLQRFARAPQGHQIAGISATVAGTGVLHVFARTRAGDTFVTWQNQNGSWSGGGGGWHAGLSHFARRPG